MTREEAIKNFNPSQVGIKNGNFIGLPFDADNAQIVLLPVNWDATVSYGEGTATGPLNILEASSQLDLEDPSLEEAWTKGIYMMPTDTQIQGLNSQIRSLAKNHIDALEEGKTTNSHPELVDSLATINQGCLTMVNRVEQICTKLLDQGKFLGLIGGDHSTPLGYFKALGKKHSSFAILTIDAHMDQRAAYEDFDYSHASIFYNTIAQIPQVEKIVHAGIRDYCKEEKERANQNNRIKVFYDHDIQSKKMEGIPFRQICMEILDELPKDVYISFDIDGLKPHLCPNTGTPVAGGFEWEEVCYLFDLMFQNGKRIIGFDLCETAGLGHEWDGNVAARLVYKLCNLMAKTNQL
jgi:agmatinase